MQGYLLLAVFFLVAIAVFVFQNTTPVTVHFLSWMSPEIPLAVVVLITACTGALVTFLLDTFRYFKIARKIKDLTSKNLNLQKEIENLERKNTISKENTQNWQEDTAGE